VSGPRVFLEGPASPGGEVRLPEASRHHLLRVRRLRPGDRLSGVTPDGLELELELLPPAGTGALVARVLGARRRAVEPGVAVTLALAVARGPRMDWVVEKAVEIGAAAILPLVAERSARGAEIGAGRLERWRRLARSAAAQSGRVAVPPVLPPRRLEEAVRAAEGPCLLAHPDPAAPPVAGALAAGARPARVLVAVGPEGGWTEAEVAAAEAAGARRVGLGPRVLRVETAALVLLTLVLQALGELGG
jgi:16S rRNA (uracil1498-N3)-methyltransferase